MYALNSTGTSNTTFLGDIRIHTLSPNNNGTYSQLTGSDGNQTDNYQLVDELPYSSADYVASAIAEQRDTYLMSDLPVGYHQIMGVQSNIIALKNSAGSRNLRSALRTSGSIYYGSSRSLNTNIQTHSDMFAHSPHTAQMWTSAEVNNLEGGMEVG